MSLWIGFIVLIIFFLALDLGIFNRKAHVPSFKEAFAWSIVWISLSWLFGIFVYFAYENDWVSNIEGLSGKDAVIDYLTGYILEQSLSVDNIFVIAIIFNYFHIPIQYQHRVLFWGILGAIVFRGVLIALGAILIQKFSWIIYLFALLILYSAWRMWKSGQSPLDLRSNPVIKWVKKFYPVTSEIEGERFFVKRRNLTAATPLFVALIMVETTDIMFAFDSIPAIFGITTDPFIIFTSNIFAVLGLRSLYFVLATFIHKFKYLKPALIFILFFVGIKMLLSHYIHLPAWASFVVILGAFGGGILFSIMKKNHQNTSPS